LGETTCKREGWEGTENAGEDNKKMQQGTSKKTKTEGVPEGGQKRGSFEGGATVEQGQDGVKQKGGPGNEPPESGHNGRKGGKS